MGRSHQFCFYCLALAALLALVNSASAQRTKAQGGAPASEPGNFRVGEKVEVWYLGKYYPGKITKIDDFSGWLDLEFTVDGETRTAKHAPRGDWVRKIAGGGGAGKAAAAAKEYPVRTWTDSTGKFKIEASYAGQDDAGVKLKKTDGKTIQLALDKLSPQDQQYLAGVVAPAPDANPFEAATEVAAPAANTDREAEWNNARWVAVQPKDGWSLVPDAAAPLNATGENRNIVLEGTGRTPDRKGGNDNFFESAKRILFDPAKGEAIVVLVNEPPNGTRRVRLSRCDLKSGRTSGETIYNAGAAVPVDLSPSGTFIASLPERGGGNQRKMLEISKQDGKTARLMRRWNMGALSDWSKQFEQAYFVGEDKLLTITSWGGVAALWDIDKAECLWAIKFTAHTTPALSPNRKQIALVASGGLGILDTATGDTLAYIDTDSSPHGRLAFSPDGKRLGLVSARQIQTWDLTTGKPLHDVWFPKQMSANDLDFLGGSFALIDNRFLVDLSKRIVLWQYDLPGGRASNATALAGGKYWFVTGGHNNPYTLSSVTLPDAAARSKGDSLTADGVLALKPGARISLSVNLAGASDADVRKATKNLTDQLKANGMVVDQAAPLRLEATITDGGAQTVKYGRFHFSRDGEEATVNKQVSVLSLKENGTEIWAASGSYGAPSMVRQKQGQSIQDAVNEQKANPVQFFFHVNLPKYIARHPEEGAYGKSQLK